MTGWLRGVFGEDQAKEDIQRAGVTASQSVLEGTEVAAVGEQVGAGLEADEYQRAIDLLSQREQLPVELRDEALGALRGYYQTPGDLPGMELQPMGPLGEMQGPMTQQQLIEQAMSSPLYSAILGSRRAGEESILRNRAATGGLRSGGSQKDLYDYNLELENKALLDSYYAAQGRDYANLERQDWNLNRQDKARYSELLRQDELQYSEQDRQDLERLRRLQGMEGFAGLEGNEDAIAAYMADRGTVMGAGERNAARLRGQGITGAGMETASSYLGEAQVGADTRSSALSSIFGLGEAAIAATFSDIRLKDDIRYLGTARGFNFYGWTWNEEAKKLGLEGECSGLMAHEVHEVSPDAISEKDGYLQITYSKIGVIH